MSASDSKSGAKIGLRRGGSPGQVDLSTLRAQFTSTPSPSLDQTLMQNSRFREEEKPVALQVGGSDKNELAEVAKLAEQYLSLIHI